MFAVNADRRVTAISRSGSAKTAPLWPRNRNAPSGSATTGPDPYRDVANAGSGRVSRPDRFDERRARQRLELQFGRRRLPGKERIDDPDPYRPGGQPPDSRRSRHRPAARDLAGRPVRQVLHLINCTPLAQLRFQVAVELATGEWDWLDGETGQWRTNPAKQQEKLKRYADSLSEGEPGTAPHH